jgi:biotin carboxyl carrier protein
MQPHAGGIIYSWSAPHPEEIRDDQGIGTNNPDTGAFVFYKVAGAYDSNIALVVTHGDSRRDNLERLRELLRRTDIRGYQLQTNLHAHYGLLSWILGHDPMVKPSTQFMVRYLAGIGSIEDIVRDIDLDFAWEQLLSQHPSKGAREVLFRKQTLLLRPIREFFVNSHLLGGFIGMHHGRLWREEGDDFRFAANPIVFLRDLYHYLNLDTSPLKPPSAQIWDHDEELLGEARAFYEEVGRRSGHANDWETLTGVLSGEIRDDIARGDRALWDACIAAHEGFQLGLELLLMIPRIGKESGFLRIHVDEKLEPVFHDHYMDPSSRDELIKCLSPAPEASSDEIVTPMGGHFYSREAPHLPSLIRQGDHFDKGQPLFVIEVMKMFNTIFAPFSGTITQELLADSDGKIVVKGQPIFKIVPDEVVEGESPEVIQARRKAVTRKMMGL